MAEAARVNPLVPQMGRITKIIDETPDVKTFHVTTDAGKPFTPLPGQLAMLSLLDVGEAMFSITSQGPDHLELAIKRVGMLTDALHEAEPGQSVGIRGPYGNGFPLEMMRGKDLLFIGGGIGLAPVRSLINYCIEHRQDYGHLWIIYGARSPADLCFKDDLFNNWPKVENCRVDVTVDRGDDTWQGHEGFVPAFVEELKPKPEGKVAITCGPPIMIKFVLQSMEKLGFKDEQIVTTLEMRMKCGIGKCGRCNLGSCYVCLDGPVFTLAQLKKLPNEY
ncbi:FAD/NAD(P)-binding protein [Neomoorella thermoacetica]|uniref:Anaerobic sulfite reductase subunit B n=3 Tax=Neomoorella thermoacetica TaxID=1525 RepID=A0A1D7X972_NEOTH|nr:FAD/NAD(P)-binding protein [Moorella thermoacetica]AKX93565.1 anaerobic sulfite reductase subunit B [Moorella thermoacetica]AKX96212.1 anaerobic sulfite reductase subunit B [Moorella thermoacetica]AOQ23473.1 Anaerobic sulfite reductase subunit B [Moorella thermoacetica]APC07936.1 anaerobic sulfite reductase subunit B [Moorella thermoacetica]OIQ09781.1 anaerobic sulfite reductase subunit B [Moorella thermoacetica]